MTRTSRLTGVTALVVALVLGLLGSAAVAVWTLSAAGDGATRSASLGAPANVAVAQSASNPQTSLVVTWTAPANQLPGVSYVVKRGIKILDCTASPCADSGLTAGTSYTYSVAAKLQSWESTPATGSGNTAAASVATTTTIASDANPSVVGQLVTYTATVSATSGTPTGNVAFSEGGAGISSCSSQPLTGGRATCSIRYTSTGSRSVTASFAGSTGFNASSTTNPVSQQVSKAGTTTVVPPAQSPVRTGTAVVLTAKVTAAGPGSGFPGGTVAFKDGANTITGCSGQSLSLVLNEMTATCSATFSTTGAKSITAVYSGDTGFLTSTSGATPQRVTNGNVTGISFINVSVSSTRVTPNCSSIGTSAASCTLAGTGNNAVVTADVVFVNKDGVATTYASDAAASVSWSANGKGSPLSGSLSVPSGSSSSTGQAASATRNGSNHITITYTFTDAGVPYTAPLTTT